MIQELKMQNFKSFAAQRGAIRFGGLSLIIGTNASGKSNIRDGLRFIHGISRGYSIAEIIGEKYVEGGVLQWKGIRGGVKETVLRNENAADSTRCWNSGFCGFPRGRPSGNSQNSPRAIGIRSATSRIDTSDTVASPADSNTYESAPTVRVQSGQTGVSSTTSVPCSCRNAAARGPVSSRIVVRSCCAPMNERCEDDTEPMTPSATSSSSRSTG